MKERRLDIDILKIIATLMVVILHVDGYLLSIVPFEQFSFPSLVAWHLNETFAYPAIHLFAMITIYLLIDKKNISILKSGIHSWILTFTICVLGLLVAVSFRVSFGIKEFFSCLFPFVGRAYWYVSDFLVLLFFIPLLNKVIESINMRNLKYLITILFVLISIFPTFFSVFDWTQDYSNIGLFVFLYFTVGYIKKCETNEIKIRGGWQIWSISFLLLFSSWLVIYLLSFKYSLFAGREMILYQYCSPLVISEAIGLFLLFLRMRRTHRKKHLGVLANSSLVVYLIHMHPIIKNYYIQWNILGWVNVSNPLIMMVQIATVVVLVYCVGVVVSIPFNRLSNYISSIIVKKMFSR